MLIAVQNSGIAGPAGRRRAKKGLKEYVCALCVYI